MRHFWTDKLDNLLRRYYPSGDLDALAERVGTTKVAVKAHAQKLGLKRKVNAHKPWTERQLEYLRRHYSDTPMERLKRVTGHAEKSIWQRAADMGLRKSREFMVEQGRLNSQHPKAVACRFKKGQEPPNKGKREWQFRSPEGSERCRRTQFRKGQQPHNTKPVGYERIDKEGYVLIKVEGERKMVFKHRHVWQQAHGEIPEGHCVSFRDGDKTNCDIDNLFLISREDNARRTVHAETPEARAARVAKGQAKRNETIRKDRIRIHWGMEPKSKLVKRW